MAKTNASVKPGIAPADLNFLQPAIENDRRFRKLIENNFSGISLFDKHLNILYIGPAAERITGWGRSKQKESTLLDLTCPADLEPLKLLLNEVLDTPGLAKTCSFRSKHFAGHYIWLEGVLTNHLEEPGIEAIALNFKDVTEQKLEEELLKQKNSELFAYKFALDEAAIVSITDQKGIIRYVNDKFCQISKYSAEELIGQDHRIVNSSYHDKAYIRNLWVTIASGKTWKGEFRNKAKDESFYWVDATIVPFLNEKGKPYRYVAIRFDITDVKESEKRYNDVFHFSPLPMWVVDLESMKFLDVNRATLDHYGYSREEFLSMTLRDIRLAEDFPELEESLQEIRNRPDGLYTRMAVHKKKNGELIKVEVQFTQFIYKGVRSNIVIATDMTERLNYIKAIEEQNEKLREISWIQSHIVRAPLARIMALVPLLKDLAYEGPQGKEMLEYLLISASELDETIKAITDKTKVDVQAVK